MDNIDLEIIKLLQIDGRTPFTEIAKKMDVSEGTVRNRVARLVEDKIIQIVGLVDPYQLGYDAPALIGISVQPTMLESAASQIAKFPEVSYLIMVSGEFDLIVEVMCRNRDELATFLSQRLRTVPGIIRTQTSMILRTFKMAYGAQPSISLMENDGDE